MVWDHVNGHVQQSLLISDDSSKHGTRFQFGGTPEIGCQDGLFTLKSLLNARHNHGLASYVGFVDLVKAYDTANHVLHVDILCKYGAPPKFATAIENIYRNNTCVLKIENEITEIPQTVGVRQGDNMPNDSICQNIGNCVERSRHSDT